MPRWPSGLRRQVGEQGVTDSIPDGGILFSLLNSSSKHYRETTVGYANWRTQKRYGSVLEGCGLKSRCRQAMSDCISNAQVIQCLGGHRAPKSVSAQHVVKNSPCQCRRCKAVGHNLEFHQYSLAISLKMKKTKNKKNNV